ncbi:tetratricopeptide repeat protein [Opitutus sp. ER46]|uniref:tetratricopeptide repeat protein n=1 Tax=Opitutus sp. ER46 TaxID=2161864 RepID=UPI001304DCBD|nr:tetratricopeptide repeat protein [Opitutus sp. ER46]
MSGPVPLLAALVALAMTAPLPAQDSAAQLLSRTGGRGGNPGMWSSVAELEKAANLGDALACAAFGEMLVAGEGMPTNIDRGIDYLERAARAGESSAAFRLGKLLETGQGVPANPTLALTYYRAAAAGGAPEAFYNLGAAYASGRGVKGDVVEALAWMILARENHAPVDGDALVRQQINAMRQPLWIARGEARAKGLAAELATQSAAQILPAQPLRPMGGAAQRLPRRPNLPPVHAPKANLDLPAPPVSSRLNPVGPPVSVATINGEHLEWPDVDTLRRAADRGNASALYAWGQVLLNGDLVPADPDRALAVLERGAAAGSVDAAFRLAGLYTHGRVVALDDQRAFSYMLMAARGGARSAIRNVGALYANGRGTPQNYTEALAWLIVAENYGSDFGATTKIRSYLQRNTPDQIPIAEHRAAELTQEIESRRREAR